MAEFAADITDLGDKIAALTVTKAVELSTYLEEVHKIKPAAGGVVMQQGRRGAAGRGGTAEVSREPADGHVVRRWKQRATQPTYFGPWSVGRGPPPSVGAGCVSRTDSARKRPLSQRRGIALRPSAVPEPA